MRPSIRLISLILAFATLSVILSVWMAGQVFVLLPLWGVLCLLVVLDLAFSLAPRHVEVTIDMPDKGFIGHDLRVKIGLKARHRKLPQTIAARFEKDEALLCDEAEMTQPHFEEPGKKAHIMGAFHLSRRGEFALQALWLTWPSRLKLLDIITRLPMTKTITVIPDISPVLSGAIQLQMIPLDSGTKDLNLRGEGSEFHQLRDFIPGMDPRAIDWKRSARVRELVVRETRAERNHQIILCLDSGRLMMENLGNIPKIDRAVSALLSMCWAGGIAGDLVGFYSFDAKPKVFLPARPGRAAFARLQNLCASLRYEVVETNHTLGLTHLATKLSRRSLIVIFSDFVDSITAELMVENITVLARHHVIIYVALADPVLEKYAEPDKLDMEHIARASAAGQILQERRLVLDQLDRLGVLCLDTNHERLTSDLIARYIEIKMREMI